MGVSLMVMHSWRCLPIGSDFPLTTNRPLIVGAGSAANGVALFLYLGSVV